ncbi:nuclear transport factor 2 family protein [Streptomyces sp. NPDC059009]|uniref:nuclear transport factor 2 family protein n=1 Tax=Streptomyces sp. NPDC059009 TaxID=3346694 RepID=UPI00369BEA18
MTATDSAAAKANIDLVNRFYDAYAVYDLKVIREEILAPGIRWHIPGRHPLAGTHEGVDDVIAFFDKLGESNFKAETIYLGADETYVVDVHRGWSDRGDGNDLDQSWVLVWRIENGRVVEARDYAEDQASADTFFYRAYPLAPVTRRLA